MIKATSDDVPNSITYDLRNRANPEVQVSDWGWAIDPQVTLR